MILRKLILNFYLVHYDNSSMNNSEEEYMLNHSIKNILDPSKERKLIKVDFSALARLVVCLYSTLFC